MAHRFENNPQSTEREEIGDEIHQALAEYLSRRPDLGLGKMLLNVALEPANPFNPRARRILKKGFVLVVLVVLSLAATFIYFNLLTGG